MEQREERDDPSMTTLCVVSNWVSFFPRSLDKAVRRTIGETHEHVPDVHIQHVGLRCRCYELACLLVQEFKTLVGVLEKEFKRAVLTLWKSLSTDWVQIFRNDHTSNLYERPTVTGLHVGRHLGTLPDNKGDGVGLYGHCAIF